MDNDIDPPSFMDDDIDYNNESITRKVGANTILTDIPVYEVNPNKTPKLEKSFTKSKIAICAVDKKTADISDVLSKKNINININKIKEPESKNK
jgi:hypothetical protein